MYLSVLPLYSCILISKELMWKYYMLNVICLWSAYSLQTMVLYNEKKFSEQQNIKTSVSKGGSEADKSKLI